MKTKTSAVWYFYDVKQADEAKCRLCGRIFPRKSKCTTNLRSHIRYKHAEAFEEILKINAEQNGLENQPQVTEVTQSVSNEISVLPTSNTDVNTCSGGSGGHNEAPSEFLDKFNRDEVSAVTSKPVNVSRNDEERIEDHNKHESNFKKDTEDKYTEPPREAAQASENVWHYFDKIPSNKARCILCKETFNRYTPFLMKHMSERHRNITLDIPTDSDDDQGCYTDVVYLEDHQPVEPTPIKPNPTKRKPEPTRPPRQPSPTYNYVKKVKENEPVEEEVDEDIGNFARYVIGLLKKLPKDICMQLQMDIINMVMTAKLNTYTMAMNEALNANMNTIQDGVILSSSNAIVTTPSNVIHAGQTRDNLPSLVIGIDRGMYS